MSSILNSMALRLLSNGVKLLLGSADWSKVLMTVSMLMMDASLTGDQKRQKAIGLVDRRPETPESHWPSGKRGKGWCGKPAQPGD